MRFKYYLRGIGIGILITVIVLAISGKTRPATMSDDEVKKRAKELGMVESNDSQTILDMIEEASQPQSIGEEPISKETEETTNPQSGGEITNPQETGNVPETITVTVTTGMFSDKIAYAMANAGLINDATEFNKFLIQNGYDSKICAGDHVFTKGMSFEELAVILTTKK